MYSRVVRWPAEVVELLTARGWTIDATRDEGRVVEVDAHRGAAKLRARRAPGYKTSVVTLATAVEAPSHRGDARIRRMGFTELLRSIWWDAPWPLIPLLVFLIPIFLFLAVPVWLFLRLAREPAASDPPPAALGEAMRTGRFLGEIELRDCAASLAPYQGSTRRGVTRSLDAIDAVITALGAR